MLIWEHVFSYRWPKGPVWEIQQTGPSGLVSLVSSPSRREDADQSGPATIFVHFWTFWTRQNPEQGLLSLQGAGASDPVDHGEDCSGRVPRPRGGWFDRVRGAARSCCFAMQRGDPERAPAPSPGVTVTHAQIGLRALFSRERTRCARVCPARSRSRRGLRRAVVVSLHSALRREDALGLRGVRLRVTTLPPGSGTGIQTTCARAALWAACWQCARVSARSVAVLHRRATLWR